MKPAAMFIGSERHEAPSPGSQVGHEKLQDLILILHRYDHVALKIYLPDNMKVGGVTVAKGSCPQFPRRVQWTLD